MAARSKHDSASKILGPSDVPTPLRIIMMGQAWRKAVDGAHHKGGRTLYGESNYSVAMLRAMAFGAQFYHPDYVLTPDDLEAIHRETVRGVGGTNYDRDNEARRGIREGDCSMRFDLAPHNSSQAGFVELFETLLATKHRNDIGHFYLEIIDAAGNSRALTFKEVEAARAKNSLAQLADQCLHQQVIFHTHNYDHRTRHYQDPRKLLQVLLDNYYRDISAVADNPHEQCKVIATFCRSAAQLHPYLDANGRSFCMMLPDILCQQQGLPVGLFREVNVFGNFSIDEIADEMLKAMERTDNLIQGLPLDYLSSYFVETHKDLIAYELESHLAAETMAEHMGPFELLMVAAHYDGLSGGKELSIPDLTDEQKTAIRKELIDNSSTAVAHALIAGGLFSEDDFSAEWANMQFVSAAKHGPLPTEDSDAVSPDARFQAAMHCVRNGAVEQLEKLLPFPDGLDINRHNSEGSSLLAEAVRYNQIACVDFLLTQGADPKTTFRGEPLSVIAAHNQSEVLFEKFSAVTPFVPDTFMPLFDTNKRDIRFFLEGIIKANPDRILPIIADLKKDGLSLLLTAFKNGDIALIDHIFQDPITLSDGEYCHLTDWIIKNSDHLSPKLQTELIERLPIEQNDRNIFQTVARHTDSADMIKYIAEIHRLSNSDLHKHFTHPIHDITHSALAIAIEKSHHHVLAAMLDYIKPSDVLAKTLIDFAVEKNNPKAMLLIAQVCNAYHHIPTKKLRAVVNVAINADNSEAIANLLNTSDTAAYPEIGRICQKAFNHYKKPINRSLLADALVNALETPKKLDIIIENLTNSPDFLEQYSTVRADIEYLHGISAQAIDIALLKNVLMHPMMHSDIKALATIIPLDHLQTLANNKTLPSSSREHLQDYIDKERIIEEFDEAVDRYKALLSRAPAADDLGDRAALLVAWNRARLACNTLLEKHKADLLPHRADPIAVTQQGLINIHDLNALLNHQHQLAFEELSDIDKRRISNDPSRTSLPAKWNPLEDLVNSLNERITPFLNTTDLATAIDTLNTLKSEPYVDTYLTILKADQDLAKAVAPVAAPIAEEPATRQTQSWRIARPLIKSSLRREATVNPAEVEETKSESPTRPGYGGH